MRTSKQEAQILGEMRSYVGDTLTSLAQRGERNEFSCIVDQYSSFISNYFEISEPQARHGTLESLLTYRRVQKGTHHTKLFAKPSEQELQNDPFIREFYNYTQQNDIEWRF